MQKLSQFIIEITYLTQSNDLFSLRLMTQTTD